MAQPGGGCMINQAIHTLDQMQLLGGPIKNITGQISNLLHHEIEVEDTAVAHIEFENGVAGTFFRNRYLCKEFKYRTSGSLRKRQLYNQGLWSVVWTKENENEKTLLIKR